MQGDRCEVTIVVTNPSPIDLNVSNMDLITEEVAFEPEQVSFTLASSSQQMKTTEITLAGKSLAFSISGLLK